MSHARELSFGWTSNNLAFGAVHNPYDVHGSGADLLAHRHGPNAPSFGVVFIVASTMASPFLRRSAWGDRYAAGPPSA